MMIRTRGLGQDASQAAAFGSATGSANTPIFTPSDIIQLELAAYAPWLIGGALLLLLLSMKR